MPELAKTLFSSVFLLVACQPTDSGNIEATRTGSLLDPPAVRVQKTGVHMDTCGSPVPAVPSITRSPYLQLVDASAATVVWTTSETDELVVDVSKPLGETFARFPSHAVATTVLPVGEQREARLADLQPSTTYCYTLRDASGASFAGPFGFRTAPVTGSEETVHIIALGDSGSGDLDQIAVAEQLPTVNADLLLHMGDVAYPHGSLTSLEATFFQVYDRLLSSIPVYLAPGNHDYESAGGAPFREVFSLPENGGDQGKERWYSFDWGPVHVVALDSESALGPQVSWFTRDMEETQQPWKIVMVHWGPYSSGPHISNWELRYEFRPLFERYGVHLVLSGHDHHYERSRPIGHITYIVTGGGGAGTRPVQPSDWTAFSLAVQQFLYIKVEGELMRVHAIDGTGQEFDGVEIPRDRSY